MAATKILQALTGMIFSKKDRYLLIRTTNPLPDGV